MCAHAKFISFGRTDGIGRVPMPTLSLLAELKALGVCPCRISLLLAKLKALGVCPCRTYYFWQNWGHWACADADFITFGRAEGIGRVPMQNFITFGKTEGIGCVPL